MRILVAMMALLFAAALHAQEVPVVEAPGLNDALKPEGDSVRVVFARAGSPALKIVVAAQPTAQEKAAAETLKGVLSQMTDASFEVVSELVKPATAFLSVGDTAAALAAGFGSSTLVAKEELLIRVGKDGTLFLNGQARNPANSVYALLEEDLGCRWYAPKWSRIPHDRDLTGDVVPRNDRPSFRRRQIISAAALCRDWSSWPRANRVMPDNQFDHLKGWMGHSYNAITPKSDFPDHPERFMQLADSSARVNWQLCPMNKTNQERAVALALKAFAANKDPKRDMLNISHNDTTQRGTYCHCPVCMALIRKHKSPMAPHLVLVNKVAKAIAKDYPKGIVDFYVYRVDDKKAPEGMQLEPNTAMWYCLNTIAFYKRIRNSPPQLAELEAWLKLVKRYNVWEYGPDFSNYWRVMPSLPAKIDNLKFWAEHGAEGIFFLEQNGVVGGDQQCLRAWMLAKLLWDSKLDPEKLARDFCDGVFGPAAHQMYAYYRLVSDAGDAGNSIEDFYGIDVFLARASALFEKAYAKAEGNSELISRIDNHYAIIGLGQAAQIFNGYPANKDDFPKARYAQILERLSKLASQQGMKAYSESRTMAGYLAELRQLRDLGKFEGRLTVAGVNMRKFYLPTPDDELSKYGKAPAMSNTGSPNLVWEIPVNLLLPSARYQLRVLLRPEKRSASPEQVAATAYLTSPDPDQKRVREVKGSELSPDEYRWFDVGAPFVPAKGASAYVTCPVASDVERVRIDEMQLVPVE